MSGVRWRPLTEGAALIVPLFALGAAALFLFPPLALPLVLLAVIVTLAFRDPERAVEAQPDVALSPCDGRVLAVRRVFDEHWQAELTEIAVFLALYDVHVQRFPLAATIEAQQHTTGGYRPAMTEAATHGNNQLATYLHTAWGPCTLTQISGILARRIVVWRHPPDAVAQGERLGMIKFGSQVTLRLPRAATVLVEAGQHMTAGITPVARLDAGHSG